MKLQRNELISLSAVIGYIAFFTHPPPSHISNLLESPVGHAIILLGILYVIAYQSLIVGIFLGIAYLMSVGRITEHMDTNDASKIPVPVLSKDRAMPNPGGYAVPTKPAGVSSFPYQPLDEPDMHLFPAEGTACVYLPNSPIGKNIANAYENRASNPMIEDPRRIVPNPMIEDPRRIVPNQKMGPKPVLRPGDTLMPTTGAKPVPRPVPLPMPK